MSQRIDAIFENGVFRPESPVDIPDGEHVSLDVESKRIPSGDLSDVVDLLDTEFVNSCRQHGGDAPSLEEVRTMLNGYTGSLAQRIGDERDER